MRKRAILLAVLLAGISFGGCGGSDANPSVTEGMAAVEALDYQTALQCFGKALEEGEDQRLLYRGQGLAYMGMTEYGAAAEAFEKALGAGNGRVDDLDYDINYYLATTYYKLGQTENGIRTYNAILALRPKDRMAYYLRGSLWLESDYERAKADFDQAVSLGKEDYDLLINIYLALERHGYKEVGQEYLQTALGSEAKSMTNYQKGRMYYYLGDYENAKNYLESARKDGGPGAVLLLGQTYEELGDFNYAISVYSSYLESDPENARVYNRLGMCRMEMKAYEEALTAFQTGKSIENNDMMQTLRFNEIVTYEKLGDYKQAASLLGSYLSSYPDDEAAQREYIFLKTR